MHTKTDSDVTSVEASSTPPRSPRRMIYYVQSPSHSIDKMSYGSSPTASPTNTTRHYQYQYQYQYHCSPIHHSRESSTSRFSSASLKNHNHNHHHRGWRKISDSGGRRLDYSGAVEEDDDDQEIEEEVSSYSLRFYVACFLLSFLLLFTTFSFILWGASKSYRPQILVKNMVFLDFTIQAGTDGTGVATDMLSLNSTVKIIHRNPATFFGVHVTSSPLDLYYYNLKVASGKMKKFYQKRKSNSNMTTTVHGRQIPLYGGMSAVSGARDGNNVHTEKVNVGLNLTFTMTSRAYILGRLVKSNFYSRIRCPVTLDGTRLGKPINLIHSCVYT